MSTFLVHKTFRRVFLCTAEYTYRVFLLLRDGLHVEGFEVNVGLDEVLLNLLLDRVSLGSNNVELAFGVIHVHRKVHLCVTSISSTERQIKVCTWLREISSCSCLTVLPGPAWLLLNKTYKPLFTLLY